VARGPTGHPDFYAQAINTCEKVRFRPELALTRLDLAELLLAHYPDEHETALEHLVLSMSEFSRHAHAAGPGACD
jgi:hypothetical protein